MAFTILMKFSHHFRLKYNGCACHVQGENHGNSVAATATVLCGKFSSYSKGLQPKLGAKSKVSALVRDAENASAKFLMYFRQVCTHTHTQETRTH